MTRIEEIFWRRLFAPLVLGFGLVAAFWLLNKFDHWWWS
jgi:hypothetical protein